MALPIGISVGVDIGVSTSEVSYCFVDPSGKAETDPISVPLHIDRAHLQPTILGKIKRDDNWGTGVKSADDRLTLLKLALLDDELKVDPEHPEHTRVVQQELYKIAAAGYDGVTVLAEYMRRMWLSAKNQIERGVAARFRDKPVNLTVSFVFSIPAVWGERTIERMEQAIAGSGITDNAAFVDLMLEPEAAALAVLPAVAKRASLVKGNTVVIADLGGGTVDFISYTLSSPTSLLFQECAPGEGKLLGDMFMQSALRSFIIGKVEGQLSVSCESLDQIGFQAQVDKIWNDACTMKEGATELAKWSSKVVVSRLDGVPTKPVPIKGSDVVKTFQSVTDGIVALAQSQMDAAYRRQGWSAQGIIVVGGFGRNLFLQEELRTRFGKRVYFTEDDGQLAVKNGATIHGVAKIAKHGAASQQQPNPAEGSARINARIARQSYGAWMGNGSKDLVEWFITKYDTVDDSRAPIFLPIAAFQARTDRDQPCVPIYSCGRELSGFKSINDLKYKNPCQIRCKHPEHFNELGEWLQLRPRLNQRQQVEFDLPTDLEWMFEVEKLK